VKNKGKAHAGLSTCKSVAVIPVRVMIVIAVYCREAQCGNERSNHDSREPTFWKDILKAVGNNGQLIQELLEKH